MWLAFFRRAAHFLFLNIGRKALSPFIFIAYGVSIAVFIAVVSPSNSWPVQHSRRDEPLVHSFCCLKLELSRPNTIRRSRPECVHALKPIYFCVDEQRKIPSRQTALVPHTGFFSRLEKPPQMEM
jgi:hypothetical protein